MEDRGIGLFVTLFEQGGHNDDGDGELDTQLLLLNILLLILRLKIGNDMSRNIRLCCKLRNLDLKFCLGRLKSPPTKKACDIPSSIQRYFGR